MRIGVDARCLMEGRSSGVETYTRSLLETLFEIDTENEYHLFINSWHEPRESFAFLERYPRVRLHRFRFPNKLLNACFWYLGWPKIDRLLGGVDLFFLPNLNFLALSREVPLVVTAHDLSFELFPENFTLKRRLWHFLVNFRELCERASLVIAVSASTKNDVVRQYRIPHQRVVMIPSGISKQFRVMSRNDLTLLSVQEKYRIPHRNILFLGTNEPRKNILSLVEAFETFQRIGGRDAESYSLVIAGNAGWEEAELRARIRRSPVSRKIILPGFVEEKDKPALYNLATIFVYPSLYEGFGFPALEALACGVPVVASHASSLPEVLGNAALLIDPYRPDEIASALHLLVRDRELRAQFADLGPHQAGLFDWGETARLMKDVFSSQSKISPS